MSLNGRRDRGLVIPLFALVLVVLLIMVAFAVDYGATAERRRASQNRSDAAALAAAYELGVSQARFADAATQTTVMNRAVAVAKEYVERNGGIGATDSAWDPGNCVDANALARKTPATDCISFSQDLTQVRVRVPDERVDYRFAPVVGIDSGDVRSSAVAEVFSSLTSKTRPILLRVGAAGLNCIEGGGNNNPQCPGYRLDPGDFGGMDSPRYTVLTGGNAGLRGALNFALGIDHGLRLGPTNGTNYCDASGANNGDANKCASPPSSGLLNNTASTYDLANYLLASQGGNLQAVTDGLIGEGNGTTINASGQSVTALLYRPDGADSNTFVPGGSPATPWISYGNKSGLNGVHIAEYLMPGLATTIGCSGDPDQDDVNDAGWDTCNTALHTYINTNLATRPVLFRSEIINSPRFGVAPVTDSSISGNSEVARIVDFYGIYIDQMSGNNNQVMQLRAFVFPLSMVEPVPGGSGPGLPYVGGPFGVRLIR